MALLKDTQKDYCARLWDRLGRRLRYRPGQILGLFTGLVIMFGWMTANEIHQADQDEKIAEVRTVLCSSNLKSPSISQLECEEAVKEAIK